MNTNDAIFSILANYAHNDFYVGDAIKQKHIQSAISFHGVNLDDVVIAVIDSTVFGSAENGMSITPQGIFWKNDWANKTRINKLSWSELASISRNVEAKGSNVLFAPGIQFYSLGMKPAQIISMLQAVIKFYDELRGVVSQEVQVELAMEVQTVVPLQLTSSLESSNQYAETLGRYAAVLVCHSGAADEAPMEVAVELLADQEIENPGTIDTFSSAIEQLEQEAKRSPAFFKLRQVKILSEVFQLSADKEEKILIICEAVADMASNKAAASACLEKVRAVVARD